MVNNNNFYSLALLILILKIFFSLPAIAMEQETAGSSPAHYTPQKLTEIRQFAIKRLFKATIKDISKKPDYPRPTCYVSCAKTLPGSEEENSICRILKYLKLAGIELKPGLAAPQKYQGLKGGQSSASYIRQLPNSRFAMALFTPSYEIQAQDLTTVVYQEAARLEELLRSGDSSFYIPVLLAGKAQESIPPVLDHSRRYYDFAASFHDSFFLMLEEKFLSHSIIDIETDIDDFLKTKAAYMEGRADKELIKFYERERKKSPPPKPTTLHQKLIGHSSFPNAVKISSSPPEKIIPSEKKIIRILTIDGGGISSIIPVTILEKMEERLRLDYKDMPIHLAHYFDIMAATSVSSVIMLGLSVHLSAEDIARLYLATPNKLFSPLSSPSKGTPLYDSQFLEKTLQDLFGDKWLKEAMNHILISADNLGQSCAYLFDSHQARLPGHNFMMKDVARAACARFNDFFPVTIKDEKRMDDHTFADGERYAYDPTFEAIKVAEKDFPECDLFIVSLGTGEAPRRFGDLMFSHGNTLSTTETKQHQKDRHLEYLNYIKQTFKRQGRNVKYIRMQVPVEFSLAHAPTLENIKNLRNAGLSFTNSQNKKYKKFEKVLQTLIKLKEPEKPHHSSSKAKG